MKFAWTPEAEDTLKRLHGTMTVRSLAETLGTTPTSVRAKITRLGIAKKKLWTKKEEDYLKKKYLKAGTDGVLNLNEIAVTLGRNKSNVCTKAKSLGMETNPTRRVVHQRKEKHHIPKHDSEEARWAFMSEMMKKRHKDRGHPMLGKHHTETAKMKIAEASRRSWAVLTEEEKLARSDKLYQATIKAGKMGAPKSKRGSWKAQWREIGGKRNYYRSAWEANYACYLQWLKERGEIQDWEHEPETFWFEAIKRGVRSYKPDFRVWENSGQSNLHEVKGWMCSRSKTTLKRMAKYHPQETIILIQEKQYKAISKHKALIPGWA